MKCIPILIMLQGIIPNIVAMDQQLCQPTKYESDNTPSWVYLINANEWHQYNKGKKQKNIFPNILLATQNTNISVALPFQLTSDGVQLPTKEDVYDFLNLYSIRLIEKTGNQKHLLLNLNDLVTYLDITSGYYTENDTAHTVCAETHWHRSYVPFIFILSVYALSLYYYKRELIESTGLLIKSTISTVFT